MLKIQNKVVKHDIEHVELGQIRSDDDGYIVLVIAGITSEEGFFNLIYLIEPEDKSEDEEDISYHLFSDDEDYAAEAIAHFFPRILEAKLVIEGSI